MSTRSSTERPLPPVLASTPVPPIPPRTARPLPSRNPVTRAAVRVSCQESSGSWWIWRRRATIASCRAATSGEDLGIGMPGLYNLGSMRRWSLPLSAVAVAVVLAMVAWYALAPRATRVKAGDLAPDVSLPHWNVPTAQGTLHGLRGSPVLLILFDSSWPSSGRALQQLEKVHRRFLQDGLVVVGIALDPPQEAKALEFFLANRGITFTILMDPLGGQIEPLYGLPPERRPTTYLIDTSGRVVSVHLKPEPWARDDLRGKVASLLPPPKPRPLDSPRPPG